MKNIRPNQTQSWQKLLQHQEKMKAINMKELFHLDRKRFQKYSFSFKDILFFDFSKNIFDDITIQLLIDLANECGLLQSINNMFVGNLINMTEKRAVLHTALRNFSTFPVFLNQVNIMDNVLKELKKIEIFSEQLINGEWKGCTGKKISNVVNIGIGGSHLGPYMIINALKIYRNHLKIYFISNLDAFNMLDVLNKIDVEKTIFLVSSKSFTTEETLKNFSDILSWCTSKINHVNFIKRHFFALTANFRAAKNFGIYKKNIFIFWEWVGGRYSVWSASGLSIALAIGFKNFKNFLYGAYIMDEHFKNTPFNKNIPVISALLSIWYINFFSVQSEAILPYCHHMHAFPQYLQQMHMESNGKSIDRNGDDISWNTSSIIWGDVGTNGQHSFHQLLHQGTILIPCDFIIPVNVKHNFYDRHIQFFSNFLAQTKSLAFGKNFSKNKNNDNYNMVNKNLHNVKSLSFQNFFGNRPSSSIILKEVSPITLGSLLAFYEHKVFVQGVIWNIFSFDQWGVNLGKELSNNIYKNFKSLSKFSCSYDSSTNGLLKLFHLWSNNKK